MKLSYSNYFFVFIFIFILLLIFPSNVLPQDLDITPYLKKIESGNKEEVTNKIPGLKQSYPNSPSLIYLEGLLTEDGEKAYQVYKSLVDKYPNSKYADDAVYRIYTYFYAIDKTDKADFYLNRLKTEYPESPYLKLIDNVTLQEISRTKDVKEEPNPKVKAVDKDYKFTVQAGAFTRKENALKLKADFDKAGYSSQVSDKSVGGSLFHVVNVGKFTTDEEAKSFLGMINSKYKLQGWVVKLD